MKKFCLVVIVLMLLIASGAGTGASDNVAPVEGEILVRSIPWYSDLKTVASMLLADGIVLNDEPESIQWLYEYAQTHRPYSTPEKTIFRQYEVAFPADGLMVAGHKVNNIYLWFVHDIGKNGELLVGDDNTRLIRAEYRLDYNDAKIANDDLIAKLTELYGSPVTTQDVQGFLNTTEDDVYNWSAWTGENNSGVFLEYEWEREEDTEAFIQDASLSITYGITNIMEEIPRLEDAAREKIKKEEQERLKSESSNKDGL